MPVRNHPWLPSEGVQPSYVSLPSATGRRRPIDFRQLRCDSVLRQVVDHFSIVDRLGNPITARGHCQLCKPTDSGGKMLKVDFDRGIWYCHSCREGGDGVQLFSLLGRCDVYEAAIEICRQIQRPVPYLGRNTVPRKVPAPACGKRKSNRKAGKSQQNFPDEPVNIESGKSKS